MGTNTSVSLSFPELLFWDSQLGEVAIVQPGGQRLSSWRGGPRGDKGICQGWRVGGQLVTEGQGQGGRGRPAKDRNLGEVLEFRYKENGVRPREE